MYFDQALGDLRVTAMGVRWAWDNCNVTLKWIIQNARCGVLGKRQQGGEIWQKAVVLWGCYEEGDKSWEIVLGSCHAKGPADLLNEDMQCHRPSLL